MEIVKELLPDVYLLKPNEFRDKRGYLEVPFHQVLFEALTTHRFDVSQTMWASSRQNVIRGLHYQSKKAPVAKIVTCTMGLVFDVVVDLRQNKESFGSWVCCELSQDDGRLLYIPVGCAHGYLSLSDQSGVFYYQQGFYDLNESRVLAWDDPTLGIRWPLGGNDPIVSDRDQTQAISWLEYKKNPEF